MEDQNAKELHEPEFLPDQPNEEGVEEVEEGDDLTPTDRVLYVVTSPKKAFQGLRSARLGPVIGMGIVVGVLLFIISVVLMFSSGDFIEEVKAEQVERMEKMLDDPNMSDGQKASIEEQIEGIESSSPMVFMLFGSLIPAFFMVVILFLIALVIFVIAKILESGRETRVKYSQALAVAALGSVVSGLGGVIFMVIALLTGNIDLARGEGIAALLNVDSAPLSALLAALSPTYIWWYVVIGIGIAAISKASQAKATIAFAAVVIVVAVIMGVVSDALGGIFG